jgi:hypothetical protein
LVRAEAVPLPDTTHAKGRSRFFSSQPILPNPFRKIGFAATPGVGVARQTTPGNAFDVLFVRLIF